jgi:DNA-damage-inducible protein J
MSKSAQIRVRTDPATKTEAEDVLDQLGISPSAAITMFYRQIIMRRALPFTVDVPNEPTRAAIEEARSGKDLIEAGDLPELVAKLLTRRERTFDVADLLESDPDVLAIAERIVHNAG